MCIGTLFSSDSRQGNYKLQQTEKEEIILSESKDNGCKTESNKLAYMKAQKKGVEEMKINALYQY